MSGNGREIRFGNGSGTALTKASPGALTDALNNSNGVTINAGDTVWLRGDPNMGVLGTYTSSSSSNYKLQSNVGGAANNPITYRAWPGERVILDSWDKVNLSTTAIINCGASYVNFRDIEFTCSKTSRGASPPSGIWQNTAGVHNVNIINCIVHDNAATGLAWFGGGGSECYGCLFYYNGIINSNQQHNIYFNDLLPNVTTNYRNFENNISLYSAAYCLQGFASGGSDGYWNDRIENNLIAVGGQIGSARVAGTWVVGTDTGGAVFQGANVLVKNNYVYDINPGTGNGTFDYGYNLGIGGSQIINNYMIGGLMRFNGVVGRPTTMTGNTFEGNFSMDGTAHRPNSTDFPGNTFTDDNGQPGSGKVIVRFSNKYEKGRGHIGIFNWDASSTVAVNIGVDDAGKTLVASGDEYAIYWWPNFATKVPILAGTTMPAET